MGDEGRTRYRGLTVEWTAVVSSVAGLDGRAMHVVLGRVEGYAPNLGDTVAMDVGAGQLRRYTVAGAGRGALEFVGVRTGLGPATPWLESLVPGAQVSGKGPERPVLPPDGALGIVVVGDETAIGTALSVVRSAAVPVHAVIRSASALPDSAAVLSSAGCRRVSVVPDSAAHEGDLAAALAEWGADGTGVVVVGEQSANHAVRTAAVALGIPRERVSTRTFWRPDRTGLE
jgi:NADPH-dependent ferric siderophore reductase